MMEILQKEKDIGRTNGGLDITETFPWLKITSYQKMCDADTISQIRPCDKSRSFGHGQSLLSSTSEKISWTEAFILIVFD